MCVIPEFLFFADRDACRTLHPPALAVRHQFDQIDPILPDGRHTTVGLPHVFIAVDAMDHTTRIFYECLETGTSTNRANHLEGVEREHLERLLGTVFIRSRTRACIRVHFSRAWAERVASTLVLVGERLERTDDREYRDRLSLLVLFGVDPLAQVRCPLGAAGQRKGGEQQGRCRTQLDVHGVHHLPPCAGAAWAAASSSSR